MHLEKTQHLLALICTDAVSRELFFNDPDRFFREHKADNPVKDFLTLLKRGQVEFFAKSLLAKRYHAVVPLLPGTKRRTGNLFREWFAEYAGTFTPSGIHKHQEDAVAFIEWMLQKKKLQGREAELASFEKEQWQSFLFPERWKVRWYSLHPLRAQLQLSNGNADLLPAFTIIIWRNGSIRKVFSRRARVHAN